MKAQTDHVGAASSSQEDTVQTLTRALVGAVARSLSERPFPLSPNEFRALLLLSEDGPQRPTELAARLSLGPSSMTRLSDRLVDRGLLARSEFDGDRRGVRLTLRPAGERAIDDVTAGLRKEVLRWLSLEPQSRQRSLLRGLDVLSDALKE